MNIKTIGCVGVASVALALLAPSLSAAETARSSAEAAVNSGNVVHRVSHALAADTTYTAPGSLSGNKWAVKSVVEDSEVIWAESNKPSTGFKWSEASESVNVEQAGSRWGRRNVAEQAGSRWGRRDFSEQAGSRWGRRNVAEQAGSRWGRRNVAEQAGSRWGRRNVAEQAGSRWGRR